MESKCNSLLVGSRPRRACLLAFPPPFSLPSPERAGKPGGFGETSAGAAWVRAEKDWSSLGGPQLPDYLLLFWTRFLSDRANSLSFNSELYFKDRATELSEASIYQIWF